MIKSGRESVTQAQEASEFQVQIKQSAVIAMNESLVI